MNFRWAAQFASRCENLANQNKNSFNPKKNWAKIKESLSERERD